MINKSGIVDVTMPYEPRKWQQEAEEHLRRFTVLVMHRRAGKTVFDIVQSVKTVLNCKLPNPRGAYIGPTFDRVKKTAWQYYKDFLKPLADVGKVTFNESELTISFDWGPKIYLMSYEKGVRGLYFDHVVVDEYQEADHNIWAKEIRPTLSDRNGSAIITGTPAGRNQLYDLYEYAKESGNEEWGDFYRTADDTYDECIPRSELESLKSEGNDEAFQQEYMCSWDAAVRGAYYGRNLQKLRAEGRIQKVPYDPIYPVIAGWDIGFDGTSVWYAQKVGESLRLIDVDVWRDRDITECGQEVLNKGYNYTYQLIPHDGAKRNSGDKRKTLMGNLQNMGLKCRLVKRTKSVANDIHVVRNFLDRVVINDKCDKKVKLGKKQVSPLDLLSLYRTEVTEGTDVFQTTPKHDESSHIADALRTLVMGLKEHTLGRGRSFTRAEDRRVAMMQKKSPKWDVFNQYRK